MRAFLCGSDSLTGRSYGYRTDAQLKAELKQQGKPLPRYVEQEFEAYQKQIGARIQVRSAINLY